jgi:hypothetical protein
MDEVHKVMKFGWNKLALQISAIQYL